MWRADNLPFAELWCADFEFVAPPGERPDIVCLCAVEARSGRTIRLWRDELTSEPPYSIGPDSLFVAFVAQAELGCHFALGWRLPVNVLDLYVEFRRQLNGWLLPFGGRSLVNALDFHGLPSIGAAEKDAMRTRIMQGWPFSPEERDRILDYCASDAAAVAALLPAMLPEIDIGQAVLRGRFTLASARMEARGVPLDGRLVGELRQPGAWDRVRLDTVRSLDANSAVFEGDRFREDRFEELLAARGIPWPRHESGRLDLRRKTFKRMRAIGPEIERLYRLRHDLSELRRFSPAVGHDNRNRTILWPFQSKTSRTQPRTRHFLFNASKSLRPLIRPELGRALAYVDYSAEEFGIAGALSGDRNMLDAYRSGDPYLFVAKAAGAAPPEATKTSHPWIRGVYKVLVLATQYGMGVESLAERLGIHRLDAKALLYQHHTTFSAYWRWSDAWYMAACANGRVSSVFGWEMRIGSNATERSVRNWPIQTHGAEILRVACILADRVGVELLAPVHDAVLIEAPIADIGHAVALTRECMRRASRIVLDGFELRTDAKTFRYPDRYREEDERAAEVWAKILTFLGAEDG